MENCNCQSTIIHQDIVKKVKDQLLSEEEFGNAADFFKIFGDETRLKIINALLKSKMCVCDIASALSMSHSRISHQLIVLKEFKIVKFTKVGKMVYYELDDAHIKEIFDKGCEHVNE